MPEGIYRNPIKQRVRERILSHAVQSLTHDRQQSAVVRRDELSHVVDYALNIFRDDAITSDTAREYREWDSFSETRMVPKGAADLKVLYLCGPEPMNDLKILMAYGISPHNVWAIESHEGEVKEALEELRHSNTALKVHHGSLSEFFEHYPDTFDLVYDDACATFLEGKPNTLEAVLKLFEFNRLEPLSVLITNFAQIQPERIERLTSIITTYFRFRYSDLPRAFWSSDLDPELCAADPAELREFIKERETIE
jgi:hypothetical protein